MKNRFLLLFLFISISISSQITIKGTVYVANSPLGNVAVYLNNTMLGTTTNENGEFSILVKQGQYELIISYLGFNKINYSLNTLTYNKPLIFVLEEQRSSLDEIIIKKTVYDEEWKYNLSTFKREFIGITALAQECEILNPEVLHFEYDAKENILTTFARRPLQIKHKGLGYLITYELESFIRDKNYVTYLGYSRYQNLKGSKRKEKKWKKNRLTTYNGSVVHFFKSVLNNSFQDEGFIVNQFKRVPNPKRPTEEQIKKARELVRLNRTITLNVTKKENEPLTALDSSWIILRKSSLPKFADYLYKSQLKKEDIITFKKNVYYLSFDNNLSVVYTKEQEELGYITRNAFSKKREPLSQTSSLIPLKKNIILDKSGVLVNPLDIYFEGYWSYEKFANALPLDYTPPK